MQQFDKLSSGFTSSLPGSLLKPRQNNSQILDGALQQILISYHLFINY